MPLQRTSWVLEMEGSFDGSAWDEKRLLDLCFKEQKKVKRKGLLEKARADRESWRRACEEDDD